MQDGSPITTRHPDCPFAGKEPDEVVTRTKLGNGVTVALAGLILTLLVTMGGVLITVGKLTRTVEVTAEEVGDLNEGQKQIVDILANQREIQADIRNLKEDVVDMKTRLRENHQ